MARKFIRRGREDFLMETGGSGKRKSLRRVPKASEFRNEPSGFMKITGGEQRAKSIISRDLEDRFKKRRGTASGRRSRFK